MNSEPAGGTAGVEVSGNKPEVEGTVDELDEGLEITVAAPPPLHPRFDVVRFLYLLLLLSVSSPNPLSR